MSRVKIILPDINIAKIALPHQELTFSPKYDNQSSHKKIKRKDKRLKAKRP